jgi:hypothetical protein
MSVATEAAPAGDAVAATETPMHWRVLAGLLLGGGVLAGDRAAGMRGRFARTWLGAAVGAVLASAVPIARAARRPPITPAQAREHRRSNLTFTVLVAARDEAAVLPSLVSDVAMQTHRDADGQPCFELVVVDDRSTDGTGDAALSAARDAGIGGVTRVIRRDGVELPDGKGAALTAAQPGVCQGDVIVVLDADARIGSEFLATLAGYAEAGAPAITARRRILHTESAAMAAVQADEQTLDGELQRGRWALGGCSEFRGNGIVVRRDLLAEVGGWRAEALTEDLDLSSRIAAARGIRVAWAIDAEVWEEPVTNWGPLWRQRLRWAEGAIRRAFEHGPLVLASSRLPLSARLDFAAYAGQLVAPALVVGAIAGSLRRGRLDAASALLGTYTLLGGILSFDSLRWERTASGDPLATSQRVLRALRLSLFNGIWLGAVPGALLRMALRHGPVGYDKMPHRGVG